MNCLRAILRAIVILSVLGSCAGTDDLSLIEAGDPDDPRYDELRRRLDIRYEGAAPVASCGSDGTCAPWEFLVTVWSGCGAPGATVTGRRWNDCARTVVWAEREICTAEVLLRVAETVGRETVFVDAQGGTVELPPQDAESNAELARLAADRALEAIRLAGDALLDTTCTAALFNESAAAPNVTTPSALVNTTVGMELVGFFREAYQVIEDANEIHARASAAATDANRSREADVAAAEFLELAAFSSRAAAAHRLLGGANGMTALAGVSTTGFFPRDRLSAEGSLALNMFRASAMSPVLIASTSYTIDQLVGGVAGSPTAGDTLRVRLGFALPQDDLFLATPAQFYERLGISREAFGEAREYLRAERRAFDRSTTRQLPPVQFPNGQWNINATPPAGIAGGPYYIPLYASTRNEPDPPPAGWWSAIVRYDGTPQTITGFYGSATTGPTWGGWIPGSDLKVGQGGVWGEEMAVTTTNLVYGSRTFVSMLAEANDRAEAIVARMSAIGVANMRDSMAVASGVELGRGVTPMGTSGEAYRDAAGLAPLGRARACFITPTVGNINIRLDIQASGLTSANLFVVATHEALDCAVTGLIGIS